MKKGKQVWRMITNTFWTFCVPRFLLYFYLRREAKAGFDTQGWILFLLFISTGGTLWDKNSISQKPELGRRPKGKKMPWEPTQCHQWEASQAGNRNAHRSPWGMTEASPKSWTHLRIHGCKARESGKGWGDEWPRRVKEQWLKGPCEKN